MTDSDNPLTGISDVYFGKRCAICVHLAVKFYGCRLNLKVIVVRGFWFPGLELSSYCEDRGTKVAPLRF